MNPDRPRSPDGCDDDAIFADIVAHLNDAVGPAEAARAAPDEPKAPKAPKVGAGSADESSTAARAATGSAEEAAEGATGSGAEPAGADDEATGSLEGADPGSTDPLPAVRPRGDPAQWPMNPWPKNPWPTDDPPPVSPADAAPAPPAAQSWRGHEVDDEIDEHFEPPPVTPLPAGDLAFWGIIAGMVGGPLLLLYLVLFNRDAGSLWILTAIAMSVGGFVMLVSRMPGHQEDDDDGARL